MSGYRLGNAPNLYNADGSPAGQMGLDGVEYPSSVSGGAKFGPEALPRAVSTGNSITGLGFWGGVAATQQGLNAASEVGFAQKLAPLGYFRPTVTPVTEVGGVSGGVDACGNYSFSGKKSSEIIADWQTTWFPALDTAGVVPGLIYATAMFDNDIGLGDSLATVQARALRVIDVLRQKFPGVILNVGTSRADTRLSNSAYAAVALAFRDWLVTLENGADLVVSNFWSGSYSSPSAPSTVSTDFTDGAIHPTARGAAYNGRVIAAANKRITWRLPRLPGVMRSANMVFSGSVAATGAGNTGTVPAAVSTPITTTGLAVWLAGNPGALRLTYSGATTNAAAMLSQTTSLPASDTGGYVRARIVSGAEYIQDVFAVYQLTGATTIKTADRRQSAVTTADGGFQNGDELTLLVPPVVQPATLTGIYAVLYVVPWATGQIVLDIVGMGHFDL